MALVEPVAALAVLLAMVWWYERLKHRREERRPGYITISPVNRDNHYHRVRDRISGSTPV